MSDTVKAPAGNLKATCRCTCSNFKQILQPASKALKPGTKPAPDKYIYVCTMCGKELVRSDIVCLNCNASNIAIRGSSEKSSKTKIPKQTRWDAYYCCADCK